MKKKFVFQMALMTSGIVAILVLAAVPLQSFARPINGDVPVDGGLSLLIAAGASYGLMKFRNKDKKKVHENI